MERKRISTTELRKQNRNQVFRIIYDAEGPLTKQEIAKRLHMSLPTVTQNLKELFDENILTDAGADESTGGRKARLITLNKNVYFSVGIELSLKHIRFIAINLKAEELAYEKLEYPFSNTPEYRMVYTKKLEEFLDFPENVCWVSALPCLASSMSRRGLWRLRRYCSSTT